MNPSGAHKIKHAGVVAFCCLFFVIYAGAQSEPYMTSAVSENSQFRVSYSSKQEPIPLNQIHPWVLHVENLAGQPVEKAVITIDGGMPAHNHGLPTEPVATELANGEYLVEGIKFSMTGLWEMWFYIQTDTVTDRVRFELNF